MLTYRLFSKNPTEACLKINQTRTLRWFTWTVLQLEYYNIFRTRKGEIGLEKGSFESKYYSANTWIEKSKTKKSKNLLTGGTQKQDLTKIELVFFNKILIKIMKVPFWITVYLHKITFHIEQANYTELLTCHSLATHITALSSTLTK